MVMILQLARQLNLTSMRTKAKTPLAYKVVIAVLIWPALLLFRRRWRGRPNIPATGGFVVAANHVSNLDFLPVVHLLAIWAGPPKVLVKESLMRLPVVGWLLRGSGFIPVKRGTAQAASSLGKATKALEKGHCVLVYPEGTITKDPQLWPMRGRPGAVRLALDAGVPLIPLAHWGAQKLLPPSAKFPRLFPPTKVSIVVGPAVDLSDLAGLEDRAEAARLGTVRLMAAITALEAELRQAAPPTEPFNQFAKVEP
ncbi:MAG: 1-acyl-sn-glycerol-3-phosphate acyltransferase [Micrococcales bacterium]|nr:1-acyl-sn-glycerol-3-phosphate acyltransferase [Micrococcales bacterium]